MFGNVGRSQQTDLLSAEGLEHDGAPVGGTGFAPGRIGGQVAGQLQESRSARGVVVGAIVDGDSIRNHGARAGSPPPQVVVVGPQYYPLALKRARPGQGRQHVPGLGLLRHQVGSNRDAHPWHLVAQGHSRVVDFLLQFGNGKVFGGQEPVGGLTGEVHHREAGIAANPVVAQSHEVVLIIIGGAGYHNHRRRSFFPGLEDFLPQRGIFSKRPMRIGAVRRVAQEHYYFSSDVYLGVVVVFRLSGADAVSGEDQAALRLSRSGEAHRPEVHVGLQFRLLIDAFQYPAEGITGSHFHPGNEGEWLEKIGNGGFQAVMDEFPADVLGRL
ncbi:hypothetical protein ES703_68989 [subsurface metagenome]